MNYSDFKKCKECEWLMQKEIKRDICWECLTKEERLSIMNYGKVEGGEGK